MWRTLQLCDSENNVNNLNDNKRIEYVLCATDICFYTAMNCFSILLSEEECCIILDRKYWSTSIKLCSCC